jgi:hypothetical protein
MQVSGSMKIKRIISVGVRLLAICAVIAAFLFFGEKYGPHQSERAEATVYERFFQVASAIPAYTSVHSSTTAPRETFINGNRMLHTVSTTTDGIEKVLDHYTELYSTGRAKILTEEQEKEIRKNLDKIDDPQLRQMLDDLPGLENLLSARVSRMESKTLGFLGVIDSGPGDWSRDYGERLKEFAATGRISALGKAKVIMAFKSSPYSSTTTALAMWPDDNFNMYNFFPDETGDVPGEDIPDVPRFPGARRILSSVQPGPSMCGRVSIYEGPGTMASNRLFYKTKMRAHGWQIVSDPLNSDMPASEQLLYFRKEGMDCFFQFEEDFRTREVRTTIAYLEH